MEQSHSSEHSMNEYIVIFCLVLPTNYPVVMWCIENNVWVIVWCHFTHMYASLPHTSHTHTYVHTHKYTHMHKHTHTHTVRATNTAHNMYIWGTPVCPQSHSCWTDMHCLPLQKLTEDSTVLGVLEELFTRTASYTSLKRLLVKC